MTELIKSLDLSYKFIFTVARDVYSTFCFALCYSTLTADNEFRDLAKVFDWVTGKTCQKLCSSLSFIPWSDKTLQVSEVTCSWQRRFFRCITAILQSLVPAHHWAIQWNPSAIWWNPPRDDTLSTYSVSLSEQKKKKITSVTLKML